MALEAVDVFQGLGSAAVDNCPERIDAADAEAPRPPRIETAVEFWPGTEVEEATRLSSETAERIHAADAAGLTIRFFWRSKKKKNKQKQAAGEC